MSGNAFITKKIKDFVFSNWTPLYILKSTLNYGFSEWSEYRDVLFIAKKGKPPNGHRVKFVLVKKDLTKLTRQDISHFANQIETLEDLRSPELDIEAFDLREIQERFGNLMWFCGVSDMKNRDKLVSFIREASDGLTIPPAKYFREGYRAVPKGVSSFMFLTQAIGASREEEAFLTFKDDSNYIIKVEAHLGIQYYIEKSALKRSLRTGIGVDTMDVTEKLDYIAFTPYKELEKVLKAIDFKKPESFSWKDFWTDVAKELDNVETKIVTLNRINPYSPSTHLVAFFSRSKFSPSNTLNVVKELDVEAAKAFCILMNSIVFLAQFFLLKEETTGRYMHIRFYDFNEMAIFPKANIMKKLSVIFDDYAGNALPSLREQLDRNFDARYGTFYLESRKGQKTFFDMASLVEPHESRLQFDMAVCKSLDISVTPEKHRELYGVIVYEMIITRGLKRD